MQNCTHQNQIIREQKRFQFAIIYKTECPNVDTCHFLDFFFSSSLSHLYDWCGYQIGLLPAWVWYMFISSGTKPPVDDLKAVVHIAARLIHPSIIVQYWSIQLSSLALSDDALGRSWCLPTNDSWISVDAAADSWGEVEYDFIRSLLYSKPHIREYYTAGDTIQLLLSVVFVQNFSAPPMQQHSCRDMCMWPLMNMLPKERRIRFDVRIFLFHMNARW